MPAGANSHPASIMLKHPVPIQNWQFGCRFASARLWRPPLPAAAWPSIGERHTVPPPHPWPRPRGVRHCSQPPAGQGVAGQAPLFADYPHRAGGPTRAGLPECPQAAIVRHSRAQRRQACAQSLHACSLNLSHSEAQASQISAQRLHHWFAKREPRAIVRAQVWQISAHSRQRRRHSAICGLPRQYPTQVSQAFRHSRQTWMQVSADCCVMSGSYSRLFR
jgi:hypothetical protein